MFEKNEKGTLYIRLDAALIFMMTVNDANYLEVDIIIDNGEMVSFNGQINESETRIYLSSPKGGPRFLDLFDDMKSGKKFM